MKTEREFHSDWSSPWGMKPARCPLPMVGSLFFEHESCAIGHIRRDFRRDLINLLLGP